MTYGLKRIPGVDGGNAQRLRRAIASYLAAHPNTKISDTPLSSWVKWDSGLSLQKYCSRMASGANWGGGMELAGCSLLHRVNVHVYESAGDRKQ